MLNSHSAVGAKVMHANNRSHNHSILEIKIAEIGSSQRDWQDDMDDSSLPLTYIVAERLAISSVHPVF